MNVILLVVATIAIILYEVPSLVRKKLWGELVLFSVLLAFGFTLALLQALGITVPSPVEGIAFLTRRLIRLFGLTSI